MRLFLEIFGGYKKHPKWFRATVFGREENDCSNPDTLLSESRTLSACLFICLYCILFIHELSFFSVKFSCLLFARLQSAPRYAPRTEWKLPSFHAVAAVAVWPVLIGPVWSRPQLNRVLSTNPSFAASAFQTKLKLVSLVLTVFQLPEYIHF